MSSRDCIRVKISLSRVRKGGISWDSPQICSFQTCRVEQQEIVTSAFISIFACLRRDAPRGTHAPHRIRIRFLSNRIVNIMSGFAAPYMLRCAQRHDSSGRGRAWVETLRLRGRQGVSSRSARPSCQNLCLTKACRRRPPASGPLPFPGAPDAWRQLTEQDGKNE